MSQLESKIEAKIRKYAISKGCLYWKFTSPGVAGVPDRMIVPPSGGAAFLELKRLGETPEVLQHRRLEQLSQRGVVCGWTDSVQGGKDFIDALI
jgi:hypothetical protein